MEQEIFGLHCALTRTGSRFAITVDTTEARLLKFSREVLLEMMASIPEAGVGVAVGMSRRLLHGYDIGDAIAQRTLADRLRGVLLWWSSHHGIPALDGSVELWVGQNELAVGVGASRQRVHLELQQLRQDGDIELGYGKLIIRPQFFEKNRIVAGQRFA